MEFGNRLLTIRKQKKLSQTELAQRVGIHGNMLGRYERGEARPFVEMAAKLAEALGVSLDYLVGNTELELDTTIIRKIQEIQQLPEEDRKHLLYLLDNVLQNVKARKAFAS